MFRRLTLPSFSKTNWILKILGRRADGYHEIRTVFQTLDLADEISLERLPTADIEMAIRGLPVAPGEANICVRAARALAEVTDSKAGASVRLLKRVPVGAGLGGGSANAAMTLLGLNQLWRCGLSFSELMRIGGRIGSDVPLFLLGGTVVGRGRGEQLDPLSAAFPPTTLLLLYPGFEISSASAYEGGWWGDWPASPMLTSDEAETKIQRFCEAVEVGETYREFIENDFESPLYNAYPRLSEARRVLIESGCSGAFISGSGSTVVGLVDSGQIEKAFRAVKQHSVGDPYRVQVLDRSQYWERLEGAGLKRPLFEEDGGFDEPLLVDH